MRAICSFNEHTVQGRRGISDHGRRNQHPSKRKALRWNTMKICNRKTFLLFLSLFLRFSDIPAAKKWQILGLALLKILDRDRSRVWNFHYVSGNRRAECKLRIGKRDERVANYGKSLIRYRVGGEFFNSRRLIFPIRAIESIGMKYFHYHRHIRFHRFENRIGKPRPVQE